MSIRRAEPRDVARIVELVEELAEYERLRHEATATPDQFAAALFPPDGYPTVFAHVAEVDGRVVGIAVWYLTFSTWTGTNGIWLEDLYVEPGARGTGAGKGLLAALAAECVARGYPRLEWWVLDWNEPSIGFYRGLGAVPFDEWTTFRLSGDALERLGS